LLRRLAAISLVLALFTAIPARTARHPRYGGTLRVEIGATVSSLDPSIVAGSPNETAAKNEIDVLIYGDRNADGTFASSVAGGGPFRIAEWEPGKHLTLAANDDYRGGRPFVDSIEVQMGRAARDRILDLELSKTDLAEIPPEQARRAADRGVRISASQPDELAALVFFSGRPAAEDVRVRESIARSIDRAAIVSFILQKEGEIAGSLLPQWSSGTAFLFSTAADPAGAKTLSLQINPATRIVLGYDADDPLEQSVAERIVVNAREAGISVVSQPIQAGTPAPSSEDARLVRMRMPSSQPPAALASFLSILAPLTALEETSLPASATPEEVFSREESVVNSFLVIPLVWLPHVYGLGARVRDWKAPAPGESWPLADVWLEEETQ
jgi:ABC-type transport system substrate-binding protein